MVLQLTYAVVSQPVFRLSPDQLIHKVSRLVAPRVRDLALFKLNIFGQHEIPDLVPRASIVWPFPGHKLVGYDPYGKKIRDEAMIHPTDDLGS